MDARVKCPTCDGTGKVHSHNPLCWTCGGSGKTTLEKAKEAERMEKAVRRYGR